LDHDMYTDLILDKPDVPTRLDQFHQRINISFESVILDGLRQLMGPVNE